MRKTIWILLAITLSAACFGQDDNQSKSTKGFMDGTAIGRDCQLALNLLVYHPRKVRNKREAAEYAYCLGIVQATYINNSGTDFCPPDGVDMNYFFELVVRFTKQHPDLLDRDAAEVTRWALTDAYPCQKQPEGPEADANGS